MLFRSAAGGGTDVGARILTAEAEKVLGKPLVVVNKDGAGGEMGWNFLAQAKPDGYTIGFVNLPTLVSLPQQRQTGYKLEDFVPVALHVYDPGLLVVHKDFAHLDTLEKFLEYAKTNPNSITVGNNGAGASDHIGAADFEFEAGITIKHVPFNGTNDMVLNLRGKHVMAGVAKFSDLNKHVQSGDFVALAVMMDQRHPALPNVPTLKENDIDVVLASGRGVVAPKGTPKEVVDKLAQSFKQAIESQAHMDKANNLDLNIRFMGPEDFGNFIRQQDEYNKGIAAKLGDRLK